MTAISGTNVNSPITPFDSSDQYPTHIDIYGKGGYRSVNTYIELLDIPTERKSFGMKVKILETNKEYYLNSNGDWIEEVSASNSFSKIIIGEQELLSESSNDFFKIYSNTISISLNNKQITLENNLEDNLLSNSTLKSATANSTNVLFSLISSINTHSENTVINITNNIYNLSNTIYNIYNVANNNGENINSIFETINTNNNIISNNINSIFNELNIANINVVNINNSINNLYNTVNSNINTINVVFNNSNNNSNVINIVFNRVNTNSNTLNTVYNTTNVVFNNSNNNSNVINIVFNRVNTNSNTLNTVYNTTNVNSNVISNILNTLPTLATVANVSNISNLLSNTISYVNTLPQNVFSRILTNNNQIVANSNNDALNIITNNVNIEILNNSILIDINKYDSIDSNSNVWLATANSVKTSYDLANSKNKTLYDSTIPTNISLNDVWINANTGTKYNLINSNNQLVFVEFGYGVYVGGSGSTETTSAFKEEYIDAGAMVPNFTNGAIPNTEESLTNFQCYDYYEFVYDNITYVQFKWKIPDGWDKQTIKSKFYWIPISDEISSIGNNVCWTIQTLPLYEDKIIDSTWNSPQTVIDTVRTLDALHITEPTNNIDVTSTYDPNMILFRLYRDTSGNTFNFSTKLLGISIQYKQSLPISEW